jgi:uncharacterized protein (DUF433 family)
MTREQLRRNCLLFVDDDETKTIVQTAFDEDDHNGTRFDEDGFMEFFDGLDQTAIFEAWQCYRDYHKELSNYEPPLLITTPQ